jgi:hypothetical protein
MQQVKIDMISAKAAQTAFARLWRTGSGGVVRINFAYQKNFIAPASDRFAD